jgi:phospholipid-binding lipoprotein MlaA
MDSGGIMSYRPLIVAAAALLLGACATNAPPPDERDPIDPWEPYNRSMYQFNRTLDKAVIRPVARGYTAVVPDPVETGVTNFFDNLLSLQTIANLALQGRAGDTGRMIERFFLNTVFGVAGIFDVSTMAGLPDYDEDFGQTLAVWGWKESRYLMLPFLGPSTLRDGLAEFPDSYSNIVWRRAVNGREWGLAIDLVQRRANALGRESQLADAYDEYLFIRDAWMQNRRFKITGESATPDYDSFLEEDQP